MPAPALPSVPEHPAAASNPTAETKPAADAAVAVATAAPAAAAPTSVEGQFLSNATEADGLFSNASFCLLLLFLRLLNPLPASMNSLGPLTQTTDADEEEGETFSYDESGWDPIRKVGVCVCVCVCVRI
jgi:hypothetical protein